MQLHTTRRDIMFLFWQFYCNSWC